MYIRYMEINIDLPDKIYEEINTMCEYNGITIIKYVFDCVLDNYNTMKYGDLNEKLNLNKEEPNNEIKEEPPKVEKKKVGRPKKEKKIEEKTVVEVKKEEITETIEPTVNKTIKRTRILKSR